MAKQQEISDGVDTFDNGMVVELEGDSGPSSSGPVGTQAEPSKPSSNPQHDTGKGTDLNSQNDNLDTFDNDDVILPEGMDEQGNKIDGKTDLQTQEDDEKGEEEKEEPAPTGSKEEVDEEEGNDEGEEEPGEEEGADSKLIRVKFGDKAYDIEEDATVAVPVKGKKHFVPLSELKSNYSGKVAFEEKFGKLDSDRKEFETEKETIRKDWEQVSGRFRHLGKLIENAYTDPNKSFFEPMQYLVELAGGDVLQYEKGLMETMSDRFQSYSEMDEVERNLYWAKRENDILRSNQTAREELENQRKADMDRDRDFRATLERYGVDEQSYRESYDLLVSQGNEENTLTPDFVANYTALLPHAEKAAEVLSEFEDELDDSEMETMVADTASLTHQGYDLIEAIKIAGKKLGFEVSDIQEDIETLNQKVVTPSPKDPHKGKKYRAKEDPSHVETFDDFESWEPTNRFE